jgi:hypothetical protein
LTRWNWQWLPTDPVCVQNDLRLRIFYAVFFS